MNKLSIEKRKQTIAALVEGNSVRATCRMVDVTKDAVLKLLVDIGTACAEYQDKALRNLTCKRIQCDELWNFCYAKEKNVPDEMKGKGQSVIGVRLQSHRDNPVLIYNFHGNTDLSSTFCLKIRCELSHLALIRRCPRKDPPVSRLPEFRF